MPHKRTLITTAAALAFATTVSLAPTARAQSASAKEWLQLMDTDSDGTVTKTEYLAYMDKQFDKLDTDHDGTLDVKELKALRGLPATDTEGKIEPGKTPSAKQMLLKMDPDKDGTVSKDEFNTYAGAEFDKLDGDHDGTLDAKELQQVSPAPIN
jgi:Ca2+-binding EF-hand superfamily protein